MIRAVLDANALVSGFPASGGTMAALIDRWMAGRFRLVVSDHILAEVGRAWTKPYWQAHFSQSQIDGALALLRQDAEVASIAATVEGVATHPEDDVILATAVSAAVDHLATGDRQLQALGQYLGVIILSPRDFLTLLEQQPDEIKEETAETEAGEGTDASASYHYFGVMGSGIAGEVGGWCGWARGWPPDRRDR